MAELKELNLYDEENEKSYSFFVTEEEWSRAHSDPNYGLHLLHQYMNKGHIIADEEMSPIDASCAPVDDSSHQEIIIPISQDPTPHIWTKDDTILWIDCYAKEGVHLLTQKKEISAALKRASTTFNEILFEKKGINIPHQKCLSKMDLLKRVYKEKLDLKNRSGGAADKWPFFDLMHALFHKEVWVKPLSVSGNGIPHNITLSEAMKIGFIGGGKLAFALANGFITAGLAKADEITASCHPSDVTSAKAFKGIGATAVFKNKPVVERSEVVIVSVKPDVVVSALREVKDLPASKNKLFISVAMGISTATVEKNLPSEARVIRVMPNTPALVKEGAAALSRGSRATDEDAKLTIELFSAVGTCDEVPEYQMDAITALSGSGPAYVYMLIESLADGGVRCGLPRDLALRLAAQTTLGAAAMLRNGGHPAALKDNVTSPGGSTAEGTYHLEKNGFRSAIIGAVTAARDRCRVVNQQLNN